MLLHIKTKANAAKDELTQLPDGGVLVRIKAAPVEGKANKYLIDYLATLLGLPRSGLKLVKGLNNPFKTIEIDLPEAEVYAKLGLQK